MALGMTLACDRRHDAQKEHRELLPTSALGVTAGANASPPPIDVLEWIHRDSELVLGVNVAQLRGTALWRDQLEPWLTGLLPATLPALRQRCGLDLLGSLQTVTVGLRNFLTTIEGSVVVRGPDPTPLWSCLQREREALRQDGLDPAWSGEVLSLHTALGNGLTLVGEDAETARGTFGAESSSEDVKPSARKPPVLRFSPGFRELYERLDGGASGWFLIPAANFLLPAVDEGVTLQAVFGTVTLTAGSTGGEELEIDARLRTSTAERATRYAATAAARIGPQARAAFTRLAITAERDDVHLTAGLTAAQLAALLARPGALAALFPGATTKLPGAP